MKAYFVLQSKQNQNDFVQFMSITYVVHCYNEYILILKHNNVFMLFSFIPIVHELSSFDTSTIKMQTL